MATWCKACSSSDPTSDTVKVSMPVVQKEEEDLQLRRQQEAEDAARKQAEAEAEREKRRLEAELKAKAEKRAEEQRRAEEAKRLAEEQARRELEEQQRRQGEERRQAEEAALAERKRQELEKQAADRAKADAWLKKHGFGDVSAKKKSLFSSAFALHVAVKENDAEMVRCLMAAGADPTLKNSSGLTPTQLAQKTDKQGSHNAVLSALSGPSMAPRARGGA